MYPNHFLDRPKTPSFEASDVKPVDDVNANVQSPFEVHHQYINGFGEPITVVDRSGMRVTIPPSFQSFTRDFIIRVVISYSREVNVNIDRISHGRNPASQILSEVLRDGVLINRNGHCSHRLDFHVTSEDVNRHGGSLYLTNLDKVITNLNPDRPDLLPDHPYSDPGVRNSMVENDPAINNTGTFGYGIRIVDSAGRFGERYININQKIYKIPVVRDSGVADGVYLTSSGPVETSSGFSRPEVQWYAFEDADKALSLFRTVEEARTLGDVYAAKERELEEFKLEVKREGERLKAERQQREAEFEQRRRDMDAERAEEEERQKREERRFKERENRIKDEMAELEHKRNLRLIERKDDYEQRSQQRKDTSEMVKYLPAVFTGLLALFVAVQKASTR